MTATYRLLPVDGIQPMPCVRRLFLEYAESIGVDLGFQGFEQELASLPGAYVPPGGMILLAVTAAAATSQRTGDDGTPPERNTPDDADLAGCVAMRPMERDVCEMKRLFVRPEHRGSGLGRQMAVAIIDAARTAHYRCMRLDTLNTMTPAIALYRSLGFAEIAPYYDNPIPTAVYFELML